MKEQITTWLFLLLLGSGYNIESVQGQNVINEFPYELSPESYSKWTLEEGYDWIVWGRRILHLCHLTTF